MNIKNLKFKNRFKCNFENKKFGNFFFELKNWKISDLENFKIGKSLNWKILKIKNP